MHEVVASCWVRCTFVDVSFENGVMHVIYSIIQCNSNTTAFDGARYTKVEITQRCCCLDECRSMTEYGPELKLFVLKSSMSRHCFVLKSSMSWHCFEIKRTDMHVSEFLNAKCLVQVTHP